jgi:hypothetical protein
MSEPVAFTGHNMTLAPPKGSKNVGTLPIFRNGLCCVSCWQLTKEELAEVIASDGKVFITVMSGATQPPIYVGSETTVREVCADYGVWKR